MEIASVTKYLKEKGFQPTSFNSSGRLAYSGALSISGQSIQLKIVFKSKYPTDFPEFYIHNWKYSPQLQRQLGIVNISSEGLLCYIDPVGVWWDSARVLEFLQAALERVEGLLTEKIQGIFDKELFIKDFSAYWGGSHVFSRVSLTANKSYDIQLIDNIRWVKGEGRNSKSRYFSLEINDLPIPTDYESWPPKKLAEFIEWLSLDPPTYKRWLHQLVSKVKELSIGMKNNKPLTVGSVFLLNNPISNNLFAPAIFAISFTLDVRLQHALLGRRTKYIKSMSKGVKVNRYIIERADPEYIYGRNMPTLKSALTDKRIIIIGAGAIGGFLCSQLACLGAGSGKWGELVIIDHDILKPGNIGRHYLGMEHIQKSKAEAVSTALSNNHPDLHLSPINKRFEAISDQLKGSLIVNATGMQTVGVALEKLLKNTDTPILHTWIDGQGAGARTLLNDRQDFACFRCIWDCDDDTGEYKATPPLLCPDSDITLTPAGCHESYYAYPVMAAVKAATLAADAIIDFFNDTYEPRLRNLVIRKDECINQTSGSNPPKSPICPVCQ